MQSRAILLHDDASRDVFEGRVHRGEPLHGILDHQTAPLVHLEILESDCDLSACERMGTDSSISRLENSPSFDGTAGFAGQFRCSP